MVYLVVIKNNKKKTLNCLLPKPMPRASVKINFNISDFDTYTYTLLSW